MWRWHLQFLIRRAPTGWISSLSHDKVWWTLVCQTLTKEQYACWLQHHLQAETAIQDREELLFESARQLETNLHLLGNFFMISVHKCSWKWDFFFFEYTQVVGCFFFRSNGHWGPAAGRCSRNYHCPAQGWPPDLGADRWQTRNGYQYCICLQAAGPGRGDPDTERWFPGELKWALLMTFVPVCA